MSKGRHVTWGGEGSRPRGDYRARATVRVARPALGPPELPPSRRAERRAAGRAEVAHFEAGAFLRFVDEETRGSKGHVDIKHGQSHANQGEWG
mmetsp:Transcript_29607/g.66384  ORF Transcript_29607/g.66384 Transcript_29607/m.66384 type:complete len:93 (-) Transcript_29607:150-428(-)